jgi:hypothetical protein
MARQQRRFDAGHMTRRVAMRALDKAILPLMALVCGSSYALNDRAGAYENATSAQSQYACPPRVAGACDQAIRRVPTPHNGRELLVNIKAALEQGLLLSVDFYTTPNLTHFFGTQQTQRFLQQETDILIELRGLSYVPVRIDRPSSVGVTRMLLTPDHRRSPDGRVTATLSLQCTCELGIEDIDATLGTTGRTIADQEPVRSFGPHPLPARPPSPKPMGYKILTYETHSPPGTRSTLQVLFDYDGKVEVVRGTEWKEP